VPSERPQVMHSYTTLLFRLQLTASQLTVLQSVSWEQHHVTRFIGELAATTAENILCAALLAGPLLVLAVTDFWVKLQRASLIDDFWS